MKILSVIVTKKSNFDDIWGTINHDEDGTMTCFLYKTAMGLRFKLELTDSEYVYIIDNNHNPSLYSKRLNQAFERALAEYIKKQLNLEEDKQS